MNMAWDYRTFKHREILEKFESVTTIDPEFDQLDWYHDEEQVLSQLSEPLKKNRNLEIDWIKIISVWHVFGKRFQVVYQLGRGDLTNNSEVLSVRFFSRDLYDLYSQKIQAEAYHPDDIIHFPKWDAVASFFPEDASLPSLRSMIDQKKIRQHFKGITHVSNNIQGVDWKLLGYRPGERAAIKYCLPEFPLVGKTSKGNLAVEAHQRMTLLWLSPDRFFQMPQPIALDPVAGIRWETFLPGKRVEVVFSEIDFSHFLKMVCTALTRLHHVQIKDLPSGGLDVVLKRMQKKMIPRICRLLAPLSEEIESYFSRLLKASRSIQGEKQRLIHGDLHTGNLLIHGDTVSFIDLDALSLGDSAYDLALLGSRLLLVALLRRERLGEVGDAVAMLPSSYEAAGGDPISQKTFSWYLSALLVGRQLKTCVRERPPELGRLAPVLLTLAQKILESGQFEPSLIQQFDDGNLKQRNKDVHF
ncbi:MAG: aminoglycoside phosphotransferase family protein [Nitrospiria bacterium]